MNPVAVTGASHTIRRIGVGVAGIVTAGVVAFAGALGGLGGAGGLGLASAASSAATLTAGQPAASAGGPTLSVAAIGAVGAAAGFSGSGLVMAIAVALAESGGDPGATHLDSNGTVDRGVWQINSIHTQFSAACDYSPPCAAGAAFSISAGGTDWSAWVTYQQGAEIAFLPTAVAYVEGSGVSP